MPLLAVTWPPPTFTAVTSCPVGPVDVMRMSSNDAWKVFWLPSPVLLDHRPTARPLSLPCTV